MKEKQDPMKVEDKKIAEIYFLARIKHDVEIYENRKFVLIMTESPDFILKESQKTIGVELVQYINNNGEGDSSLSKMVTQIRNFVEILKRMLYEKKDIAYHNLSICCYEDKFFEIKKNDLKEVAENFYIHLQQTMYMKLSYNYSGNTFFDNIDYHPFSINGDKLITFRIDKPYSALYDISHSLGGWRVERNMDIFIKEIKSKIENKSEKTIKYQDCDEYWLVLHPPFAFQSTFDFNILDKIDCDFSVDDSNFKRIYIVNKDKIREVQVE